MSENLSYAAAGVDVEAGERAVELMRSAINKANRPEVVGDFGGFAGLFDVSKLKKFLYAVGVYVKYNLAYR